MGSLRGEPWAPPPPPPPPGAIGARKLEGAELAQEAAENAADFFMSAFDVPCLRSSSGVKAVRV